MHLYGHTQEVLLDEKYDHFLELVLEAMEADAPLPDPEISLYLRLIAIGCQRPNGIKRYHKASKQMLVEVTEGVLVYTRQGAYRASSHPMTQGETERYHRSMKNDVKLQHDYFPR